LVPVLKKVQLILDMSAGLKAEPKLQVSVLISGHLELGVSVLISAQAEMEMETNNFSWTEIWSARCHRYHQGHTSVELFSINDSSGFFIYH
jgi:uncharacterized protein YjlB